MQEENQSNLFNDMSIDHIGQKHIRTMASWAMVIVVVAVLGYIYSIFTMFSPKQPSVVRSEGFSKTLEISSADSFSSIITLILGLVINFFLFRFATQAKSSVDSLNQQQLTNSFRSLKAYFMATSIILIIVLVVLLLAALVIGLAGTPK